MENLYFKSEQIYYPIVDFNYQTGICEISGESYMEETYKFYAPVITWLQNYLEEKKDIRFNFRLTYFNTSSSKFILEILSILKKNADTGSGVEINWFYKLDDPDILTEIDDFIEETGVKINIYHMT